VHGEGDLRGVGVDNGPLPARGGILTYGQNALHGDGRRIGIGHQAKAQVIDKAAIGRLLRMQEGCRLDQDGVGRGHLGGPQGLDGQRRRVAVAGLAGGPAPAAVGILARTQPGDGRSGDILAHGGQPPEGQRVVPDVAMGIVGAGGCVIVIPDSCDEVLAGKGIGILADHRQGRDQPTQSASVTYIGRLGGEVVDHRGAAAAAPGARVFAHAGQGQQRLRAGREVLPHPAAKAPVALLQGGQVSQRPVQGLARAVEGEGAAEDGGDGLHGGQEVGPIAGLPLKGSIS